MIELQGSHSAAGYRFAIIVSRFNVDVTDGLLRGARAALAEAGVRDEDVTLVRVPGAFELPAATRALIRSKRCDAVAILAAIVRGETNHHDVLAHAVAGALAGLSAETGLPMGFGVLTCDTMEQARRRVENGAEAVEAALEIANLRRALSRK